MTGTIQSYDVEQQVRKRYGSAAGQFEEALCNGVDIGDGRPGPMWRRILNHWSRIVGTDIYQQVTESA